MKNIFIIVALFSLLVSCTKEDVIVDGGLSNGVVEMTTYDFLKSHPQLDSLAILIDKGGLIDDVNKGNTLFAPNNLSIKKYVNKRRQKLQEIDPAATFEFDDIEVETIQEELGGYIIPQKIMRSDMNENGELYIAVNGDERKISLEPYLVESDDISYSDYLDEAPEYVYFSYMVGDEWDEWDITWGDDKKEIVRTSNIVTSNGVIHVLQGDHTLFNYDE